MAMHYRLYELDERTGRIVNGEDIVADDDAQAIHAARSTYPETPFELWCSARRVMTSETASAAAERDASA